MPASDAGALAQDWLLKGSTYAALFSAVAFVGISLVLILGKRVAAGWMAFIALLVALGAFVYAEILTPPPPAPVPVQEAAPPPPPVPEPVQVAATPPPPEPTPPPEPVAEPEPQPVKPAGPYPLKIIEKELDPGSGSGRYVAQGPSESSVFELIFGDAIQSSIWEYPIKDGYQKFPGSWKSTLKENLGDAVKIESKNQDPRGYVLKTRVSVSEIREGLFQLGFTPSAIRPNFFLDRNPTSTPDEQLATALVTATIAQSHYSLGGRILTNKSLLKDEIDHLNFLHKGVRYFVKVSKVEDAASDAEGQDIVYRVALTPGASD